MKRGRGSFPHRCSWHIFAAWLHADPYKKITRLERHWVTLKIWQRLLFCLSAFDMSVSHTLNTQIHTNTHMKIARKETRLVKSGCVFFWRGLTLAENKTRLELLNKHKHKHSEKFSSREKNHHWPMFSGGLRDNVHPHHQTLCQQHNSWNRQLSMKNAITILLY